MRLTLKIFAWFEPQGRIRSDNTPFNEISIESRMENWAIDLSRISHGFEPGQEMVNFFSCELEKGRIARPPYSQNVTTDSLAVQPWMPTDEPHAKALGRWRTSHRTFGRFAGNQDLIPPTNIFIIGCASFWPAI